MPMNPQCERLVFRERCLAVYYWGGEEQCTNFIEILLNFRWVFLLCNMGSAVKINILLGRIKGTIVPLKALKWYNCTPNLATEKHFYMMERNQPNCDGLEPA